MHEKNIVYRDGEQEFEGWLVHDLPDEQPRPAVLVSHAWSGSGDLERAKARALAELGYVAFALDLYGRGRRGSTREENAALMQPLLDDRALLLRRMQCALATLREQSVCDVERVAAIGFCFGGLCVLDLARSGADVRGVVSFHGLFPPPDLARPEHAPAKVLALHGFDDPMAPPDQLTAFQHEMTERGIDWQVISYGHTVHAFSNPNANDPDFGTVYSPTADRRSWKAMQLFLAEVMVS